MSSGPVISVVLPTYNRRALLPDAIGSVFRQTLSDWELVVADDASTDDTVAFVSSLRDPRVRVISFAHSGHPETVRNRAAAECRGRYLAFLDSDDWWERDKLALQAAALSQDSASGWSYTGFRFVNAEGRDLPPERPLPSPSSGMIQEKLLSGQALVLTPTVMVRRDLFRELGGFDESLPVASDFDFWLRLAGESPAAAVERVLVARRVHPRHYTVAHRDNVAAYEAFFAKQVRRAGNSRIRGLILSRRAAWLTGLAARARREGRGADAWSALRAALPYGLRNPGWWKGAIRGLLPWRSVGRSPSGGVEPINSQ